MSWDDISKLLDLRRYLREIRDYIWQDQNERFAYARNAMEQLRDVHRSYIETLQQFKRSIARLELDYSRDDLEKIKNKFTYDRERHHKYRDWAKEDGIGLLGGVIDEYEKKLYLAFLNYMQHYDSLYREFKSVEDFERRASTLNDLNSSWNTPSDRSLEYTVQDIQHKEEIIRVVDEFLEISRLNYSIVEAQFAALQSNWWAYDTPQGRRE